MMTLIIGGSGSGKSSYAERVVVSLSEKENYQKYYLATMQVFDGESRKKVEKHRTMRAGKGFVTLEQPTDISKALDKMAPGKCIVLLECISNLTANEMFCENRVKSAERVSRKIIMEINRLKEEVEHLVVVSNNVFEDGIVYDASTMEYLRAMGIVNKEFAAMADEVLEIVVGIPVVIKGREENTYAAF